MGGGKWVFLAFLLILLASPAWAQFAATPQWQGTNWYRGGTTLDLDFANDRYVLNGSTTSGVANFITAAGATFTRAGTTNVTSTDPPFYLDTSQGQAFVSRATVSNNVTWSSTPFYLNAGQAFVSRAGAVATYFDSSGTLQTASANTARTNYTWNGSAWVNAGTLIEPAATNQVKNNTMTGAVAADGVERITTGTFSACSGATCTGWTTTVNGGTGTVSFASNTATLTGDGTNAASIYQAITTVSGNLYTIAVTTGAGNSVTVQAGTTAGSTNILAAKTITASSTRYYQFTASGTTAYVQINNTSASAATVTTVSTQSGGHIPTTSWAFVTNDAGIYVVVYAVGTQNGISYADFRIRGTRTAASESGIFYQTGGSFGGSIALGQSWTHSAYVTGVSGTSGLTYGHLTSSFSDVNSIASEAYASSNINFAQSFAGSRVTVTNSVNNPTTTKLGAVYFAYSPVAGPIDVILRIGMPQFEQSTYATSVIATTNAAVSRSADVFNQEPATYFDSTGTAYGAAANTARTNYTYNGSSWVNSGTLIEPSATNAIRNNMMLGAVASTNITGQTISSITNASGTATVTTAAVHGLTAGALVTVSGASPSNYNGTFVVDTVPSTTTFTYVMLTDPGANATVVGSYTGKTRGTAPTNWSSLPTYNNGIAQVITGTGTTNGLPYVDVRFYGKATVDTAPTVFFETTTGLAAAQGQTWMESAYLAISAGSTTNIYSTQFGWHERDSGGAFLASTQTGTPTLTATLTRSSISGTVANASTAYVIPYVFVAVHSGLSIDITIRIVAPQLEQANFATSIIPTFGSAVTRTADVYSASNGGTYFNSAGTLKTAAVNTPRRDYDPVAHTANGVLIEEARTNIVPNSYSFAGLTNGSITGSAGTAPDGNTTASKFIEDTTASARHYTYKGVTITAGSTYSYSVFVKAGTRSYAYFFGGKSGSPFTRGGIVVNLSNGSYVNADVGTPTSVTNRSVTALSNGWYRLTLTVNIDGSSTDGWWEVGACTGAAYANCSYTGDGASYIYVWGAQIESGVFSTSYIPTYGSTVTRAADVFTVPTTAGGGWYTAGQGTLAATGMQPFIDSTTNAHRFAAVGDGTSQNSIGLSVTGGALKGYMFLSGSVTYVASQGSMSVNSLTKGIISYDGTRINCAFAGNLCAASTGLTIPTVTKIAIGAESNGASFFDGWINRVWYIPALQSDTALTDYTR